jgi:hypothetical protein
MIENRGDADPGERGEHDDARHHPSPAAGSDALPSRLLSLDGGFLLAAALLPQFPSSFVHDRHSYGTRRTIRTQASTLRNGAPSGRISTKSLTAAIPRACSCRPLAGPVPSPSADAA